MQATDAPTRERAHMALAPDFGGMELLTADYWAHSFAPHVHDTFVVALIERGAERFRCGGAEWVAPAGSLVLINPGEVHSGERGCAEGWSYRAFYPAPAVLATLRAEIDDGSPAVPGFAQAVVTDPALFDLLRGLHARLHDAADPLLREGLWTAAFGALLRRHGQTRARPPQGDASAAVAKAQALLRERCAEALSLRDLADAVGLSPWHLNRAFRQKVGLPPHAWRNQWRLAQAKQRLRARLAPAVVAAELGFADQAHFSRHFKRAFGVSPGRYPASR